MTLERDMIPLINDLLEEHRNSARLLHALEDQIKVIGKGGKPDYELIMSIADYFCEYPDRCHHLKEAVVFEQLRAKYPNKMEAIGDLAREHIDAHERVTQFRRCIDELLHEAIIPRSSLVDVARSFIEAERQHMRKEEDRFFPVAAKYFTEEDWSFIDDCNAKCLDPIFLSQCTEEFANICERIVEWENENRS